MSFVYVISHRGYDAPPQGMPEVLAKTNDEEEAKHLLCWAKMIDFNYCISIGVTTPIFKRRLSKDALASMRLKRLKRRLEQKYGLFYDDFLEDELNKWPEYYAGERACCDDEGNGADVNEVMDAEHARAFPLRRMPFISEHINKITKFHVLQKAGVKVSYAKLKGLKVLKRTQLDPALDKESKGKGGVAQEPESLWLPF